MLLWDRAVAAIGGSVLIIRLIKGGTLYYMWSECLFGLLEEAGPAVAAVVVAVRPVAVYAFQAVSEGDGRENGPPKNKNKKGMSLCEGRGAFY